MESDHEGGEVFGHATLDEDPERSSGNSSSKSRSGSIHRSRSEGQLDLMQRRRSSLGDQWDMGALAARVHTRSSISPLGPLAASKTGRASPAALQPLSPLKPGESLDGSRLRFRSRSRSMELPTADGVECVPSGEAAVQQNRSGGQARHEYRTSGADRPGRNPTEDQACHPGTSTGHQHAPARGSQPQPDPLPRPYPRDTLSLTFNEEPNGGCDAPRNGEAQESVPAIAHTREDGLVEGKRSKETMPAGAGRGEAPGDGMDRDPGSVVPLSGARAAGQPEGLEAPGSARPAIPSKGGKRLKHYEYGAQTQGQGPDRAASGDPNPGQQGLGSTFELKPDQQQDSSKHGLPISSGRSSSHSRRSIVAYQSSGGFGSRPDGQSVGRTFSTGEMSTTG